MSIIHQATDKHLRELLGERYLLFREWIRKWFPRHIENLKKRLHSDFKPQDDAFAVYVYATQYIPEDRCSREVALPDKYVKFANRGWCRGIPSEYRRYYNCPANPPYTVDLFRGLYFSGGVVVWEVGQ